MTGTNRAAIAQLSTIWRKRWQGIRTFPDSGAVRSPRSACPSQQARKKYSNVPNSSHEPRSRLARRIFKGSRSNAVGSITRFFQTPPNAASGITTFPGSGQTRSNAVSSITESFQMPRQPDKTCQQYCEISQGADYSGLFRTSKRRAKSKSSRTRTNAAICGQAVFVIASRRDARKSISWSSFIWREVGRFAIPPGWKTRCVVYPGVFAALDAPATFRHPFGMKSAADDFTDRQTCG
jgi:hypothetical protein